MFRFLDSEHDDVAMVSIFMHLSIWFCCTEVSLEVF